MNCCCQDNIDCHHLRNLEYTWTCDMWETILANPETSEGCCHYITPGEHALRVAWDKLIVDLDHKELEYQEWRARCIKRGTVCGIIVLIAYVAFVIWMVS